jgi:pilus assembly protein CpaC
VTVLPHPRSAITLLALFALVGIAAVTRGRAEEAGQATQTQAEAPHELSVTVGKSLIVNSASPIDRVSVGFGEVAEATAVGPQEVLINGKAPGETSLIIWQSGGGKLFFDLTVRPSTTKIDERVDTVRRQLKKEMPDQNLNLAFENDTVFLRGTVKTLVSADRALAIAGTLGKVVNLLYVDVPGSDEQIILKVQFASVDRRAVTDLGLNLVNTGTNVGAVSTGQFPSGAFSTGQSSGQSQTPQLNISDALNIFMLRPNLNLALFIKALQTRGLVEVLAEPNVLAINGKQANFLAGGEFPYPVVQGGGVGTVPIVTIAFKEFGVRIGFLPFITPRGTVKLEVSPEVSSLDFANGLFFQGTNVPALVTRRVHTEIELESGQSFAIGGLLDRRLTETMEKIPLLADIPLLGKLFQSRHLDKQNTELLVIVTPERVRPIPHGQKPPALDMPAPLMGPDKVPQTPGMEITGTVPSTSEPAAIPMESLIQSIKAKEAITLQNTGTGLRDTTFQPQKDMPVPAAPVAPAPAAPPK